MKAIGILLISLLASTASAETIKIATTHWPPYMIEEQKTDFIREVTRRALATQDRQVRFHFLPWKRAIEDAAAGKYDAIAGLYSTPERLETFLFTAPLHGSELVLLQRKSKPAKAAKLSEKIFGVVRGYSNAPWIDDTSDITKTFAKSDAHNLTLLDKERIDVSVIDKRVADYLLRQRQSTLDNYKIISPAIGFMPVYVAFPVANSNSKDLVSSFNSGFLSMMLSGEISQLTEQYLGNAP